MVLKIASILVILFVSYVLGVFVAPAQMDEIGKLAGISEFNQTIRASKQKLDSITGEVKDLNDQTGGLFLNSAEVNIKRARDVVSEVRGTMETTKSQIESAKSTIETKIDQGKQIYDTANSLRNQVNEFTTLTGSVIATATGSTNSGSETASGTTSVAPVSAP